MAVSFALELIVALAFLPDVCFTSRFKYTSTQTCYDEMFRGRCPYSQQIFITEARYGHIEISKCVAADFGHFGCYSDIKGIVSQRCNRKTHCEIPVPDTEIEATKTCIRGLGMYMDIGYVCIPGTLSSVPCVGVDVTTRHQYITAEQLIDADCVRGLDQQSHGITFLAPTNYKIKFTFSSIEQSIKANETSTIIGYISDEERSPISYQLENGETEFTTKGHQAILEIEYDKPLFLIGFQAIGCADIPPPPYTLMTREKDKATIGCKNNEYKWQLTCVDSKWVGSTGNCTRETKIAEVLQPVKNNQKKVPPKEEETETLSKEVLFALIIGVTLFLCVVVVTTGYVYLRRARYSFKSTKTNNMELAGMVLDGEDTNSWSRKTFLRNGQPQSNNNQHNQWQQSLPKAQIIQSNGTLPANTQKYYILDRDD